MVFTTRLPRAAMHAFLVYMRSYNGQTKGALERLDIVDQLIDQRLDRCASCPRHMRRQDEVRQIKQTHEWMIVCGSSVMTTSKPGPHNRHIIGAGFSNDDLSKRSPQKLLGQTCVRDILHFFNIRPLNNLR